MFRIDKKNVKISDLPELIKPAAGKDGDAELSKAAPQGGEQPLTNIEPPRASLRPDAEAERRTAEKVAQILKSAADQADIMIREADETLRRAESEAIELRGKAWQAGHSEGRAEGERQAAERAEREMADFHTFVQALRRAQEDYAGMRERDIVELSLAIAKKIVNVSVKKDDIMFESLIKNALNQMKREGKLLIRVSEEEYTHFFSSGSAVFILGDQTVTATVVADPVLPSGGCVIESDSETLDAGVDTQLRHISLALAGREDIP